MFGASIPQSREPEDVLNAAAGRFPGALGVEVNCQHAGQHLGSAAPAMWAPHHGP